MLRSLTQRAPAWGVRSRMPQFSSPPPRPEKLEPASPNVASDSLEPASAKPPKTSFARRLGQVGLGLLGLTGAVVGAAGAVTAYQHVRMSREVCPCVDISLEAPQFEGDVQTYSDALMRQSFLRAPSCRERDRHQVGQQLQSEGGRIKYDGSKVVLISFDGTLTHEPRRVPVMQELGRNLQSQGYDTASDVFYPADIVGRSITNVTGEPTRWSGLSHGVIQDIVRDPELNQNIQLLSFPSEELEVLASPEAWKDVMPFELAGQFYNSATDKPQNVERALQAVIDIREQAKEQGRSPRFVVLSHSSGGAGAVKFTRRLQEKLGDDVRIDLVGTIDPVKEAHFAVGEAAGELALEGLDRVQGLVTQWVGGVRVDGHTPAIRSNLQPGTLQATGNVIEWINFYQSNDVLGVKSGPQVGIQGSPVERAENVRLDDLGDGGHGSIAIDSRVKGRLLDELRERVRADY